MTKINIKKNNAKGGFTLVELIAVLAIISILFTVFTPKVVGYIKEAKKTKALSEVREVVLAVNTYNINTSTPIGDGEDFASIRSKIKPELVDCSKISSIESDMTYSKMKELLEEGRTFLLTDEGKINYT